MPHSQKTIGGNTLLKREDQCRGKSEIKEMDPLWKRDKGIPSIS